MSKTEDNVNYEQLIKDRDKLIKEVRSLEREVMRDRSNDCKLSYPPVPEYTAKLLQLGLLCQLMSEKYKWQPTESSS
ncbi:MAG: hypothetical protein IKP14_05575 [Clostridiales bacterium]|nr:hypothetical protein [Clostridiales bacterium]